MLGGLILDILDVVVIGIICLLTFALLFDVIKTCLKSRVEKAVLRRYIRVNDKSTPLKDKEVYY